MRPGIALTALSVLIGASACASSSVRELPPAPIDSGADAGVWADAGPDTAEFVSDADTDSGAAAGLCSPHVFQGCSYSEDQWYWDGNACVVIHECHDSGYATRSACRRAKAECGAEPPVEECLPITCPSDCPVTCDDEGRSQCACSAFLLYRNEVTCSDSDDYAWRFGLAPRHETDAIGGGAGDLRFGRDAPSDEVSIRILAERERDLFHDPWRLEAGDAQLEVARCTDEGCVVPDSGHVTIETGGAGLVRVELELHFEGETIALSTVWLSFNDTRDGC